MHAPTSLAAPSASRSLHRRFGAVACGLAIGLGALASFTAQAQSAMPAMRGEGAARYVCGGIGSDESTAMRGAMKSHPLALLFARTDGAYLADVDVSIKDEKGGEALALKANGPVCLIDIPAGRYTVDARVGGAAKSQAVTVGAGSKSLDFRF